MSTTLKTKPLEDFIEEYVDGEPLTVDTVRWAIKKYIYMNYEPSGKDKLYIYETLLFNIAKMLNGNQPAEVQKLLANVQNWAKARDGSIEEQDYFEKIALQNETLYNLIKQR